MWKAMLLLQTLCGICVPCVSVDVIVGKDDCIGVCNNYYKASTDAFSAIQDAFNNVSLAGGGRKIYMHIINVWLEEK